MISEGAPEGETPAAQGQEGFAQTIDQALRVGWSGSFDAAGTLLVALRDRPGARAGERALCRALLALTSAALGDVAAARRLARQAISDTARPPESMPADTLRALRLARALAVNASTLVGDRVRAQRAAQVRFLAGDPESAWLVRATLGSLWQDAPAPVQRFAKFVDAVHRRFARERAPSALSPAEIAILRRVDAGTPVPEVATRLGRSEHTVRTHLRNAYAKLGAHGRRDALTRARALGLLDGGDRRARGGRRPLSPARTRGWHGCRQRSAPRAARA